MLLERPSLLAYEKRIGSWYVITPSSLAAFRSCATHTLFTQRLAEKVKQEYSAGYRYELDWNPRRQHLVLGTP
jgi:hypothetical protein